MKVEVGNHDMEINELLEHLKQQNLRASIIAFFPAAGGFGVMSAGEMDTQDFFHAHQLVTTLVERRTLDRLVNVNYVGNA